MSRKSSGILPVVLLVLLCGLFATAPAPSGYSAENDVSAEKILRAAGVKGGLVVHLNCGGGELTAALRANERYLVQGLDSGAGNVERAREHIRSAGDYGAVSARRWSGGRLPYTDDLVNLLVVSKGEIDTSRAEARAESMRVLAPRGVLLTQDATPDTQPTALAGWRMAVKPVPPEIGEWTHYLQDAGNNAVAKDTRVGPPEHLQWRAGPMWCRSHEFSSSVNALVTANGRLFGVIDEGIIGQPRGVPEFWTLVGRDAFNGKLLWKRPVARINPHAMTAVGDRLYITLKPNGPLCILDAATGEALHTAAETGAVSEISVCDNKVILSARLEGDNGKATPHLAAAAPDDGRILWKTPIEQMANNTMVAGSGRVCYYDGAELVGLDLATGQERWRQAAKGGSRGYAVMYRDTVFLTGAGTLAFAAETGKPLWKGPNASGHARNPPGLFGAGGLMWSAWAEGEGRSFIWDAKPESRSGYDALTGEVCKTVTVDKLVTAGHHIRCYPPKATERYLLLNKRGVEFFDLQGENHMRANWTRGACGFGMLPANGFLYAPPSQCFCYPGAKLDGFNALAAKRIANSELRIANEDRLEKGPAFGKIPDRQSAIPNQNDWPTYRHDARRSGATREALPVKLKRLWEMPLRDTGFGVSPEGKSGADDGGKATAFAGLMLQATKATIHGDGARKDELGVCAWRGIDTYITWQAQLDRAGKQEVWLAQSCSAEGGAVFELAVGDQKLTGQIRGTGGWDKSVWLRVGEIEIAKPGVLPVSLKPLKQVDGRLGNVQAVAIGRGAPAGAVQAAPAKAPAGGALREYPRGGISPPVAAGGRVFVAEPDAHTVHCLDAKNGKTLWRFIADGRVDSPPTIHDGLVLFGAVDGRVYCLRAADGALVWRFLAAPEDRQIFVFEQLESAWPVHGSVLVRDDKVYCTAGRSSYIDGGIYVYALEPKTGKLLHQTQLKSDRPDVTEDGGRPFDLDGTNSDILVAGDEDIHMLLRRFNPDLTLQEMPRITKLGDRQTEEHLMTTAGFLDTTWFNRTYWTYGERWPGYYFSFRGPKSGKILVFNDTTTYGLKVYTQRKGHSPEFVPGTGYKLFADRNTTKPVLDVMDVGAEKGRGFSRTEHPIWAQDVPIRARAMLLAGERLYIAGPPDVTDETHEAMIGQRGAVFRVVNAADGATLAEFKMNQAPVFDGLIAAAGRLYLSTLDGKLICFGAAE